LEIFFTKFEKLVSNKLSGNAAITTLIPCDANFSVIANPIPEDAPVTIAQVALYFFF